eukprot:7060185-Pyramimonas_sp.AAC.1
MPPGLLRGCRGVQEVAAAALRHLETLETLETCEARGGNGEAVVVGWALCNAGYGPHLDTRVCQAYSLRPPTPSEVSPQVCAR